MCPRKRLENNKDVFRVNNIGYVNSGSIFKGRESITENLRKPNNIKNE